MRIIQLPEAQSIQDSDVFVININGADYQVPVSLLVTAMQALGAYLTEDDLPLPISSGGTGSTSAQAARQALGITPANIAAVATADVANNITTTTAGKVLDARQGPALTALIDAIQAALNLSILVGSTTTIAAGTSTVSLTGLTAGHRVAFWGFSSGGENDPPADITVTTAANSYTVAVSNVSSSGVTMTPVFIKPQN